MRQERARHAIDDGSRYDVTRCHSSTGTVSIGCGNGTAGKARVFRIRYTRINERSKTQVQPRIATSIIFRIEAEKKKRKKKNRGLRLDQDLKMTKVGRKKKEAKEMIDLK